jgi:hypothetical protein
MAGEHPGTMKRFVQNLETRGLTYERRMHGRGFLGVSVEIKDTGEPCWNR